jgi:ribonuclease R
MKFSIATLLSHFVDDKLVAAKVLEKKLGCEDEESIQKLQIVLDALEKIGILVKDRGKYRRLYEQDIVEAKLRCSSKGFCFAIQDSESADDIYVRESHLSNAWNGDRVLVRIIKEGSRRRSPEGEVKLILERANPSLLATVNQGDDGYKAIPLDDRLLFELNLKQNGQNLQEAVDHLVHVSVLRYPLAQNPPLGKVTRILGSDAEAAADTDIVSCKHDLSQSFSEEALAAAQKLKTSIPAKEIEQRLDLRNLLTFTLEDENLPEDRITLIENAFTLEKTEDNLWQLGIHTVDIAHYIEVDSVLDREAKRRGTTIDLDKKIIPLFPEGVAKCCSLTKGQDRLTVSTILKINDRGELVECSIHPTAIKVDCALSYQELQSMLQDPSNITTEVAPIFDKLKEIIYDVCPLIRTQRRLRNSFDIALPENRCLYKDEGKLGAIVVSSVLPVKSLITEAVVLAGKAVAERLVALEVPGIYCIQAEPDSEELEDLLKLGNNLKLNIQIQSEEEITPQDYQHFTQEFGKSSAAKVLNYLLQTTLKPVKYTTKPGFHFGLSYQTAYTHFVSPGQRYADLWIQRILKTIFEFGRDRRHSRAVNGVDLHSSTCHGQINWNVLPPNIQEELEEQIGSILVSLNDRQKIAEDAEKDLQGLKKAEKMKERTGKIFEGLITGVQSYGFFVEIEDLLVEGLVHVSSLKDDWYEYRSRHSCLVGRKNRIAYRLGDRVEVEVKSVDYYRQQIDLVTVGGGSAANNEDLEED